MSAQKKVLIVIPVYNVVKELDQCLQSVVSQTYHALEIVLVDDGSTDSSETLCDQWAEKDSRIHVVHTENRGLSEARNRGLSEAKYLCCDYVIFIDSDDWVESTITEKMMEALTDNVDAVVCGFAYEYPQKRKEYLIEPGCYSGRDAVHRLLTGEINNAAWNKLYRIELFDDNRFPPGVFYEDIVTISKAFLKAREVGCINEVLYHYRQRAESIINRPVSLKNLVDAWTTDRDRLVFLKNETTDDKELIRTAMRHCAGSISFFWNNYSGCTERNLDIVREIKQFVRKNYPLFGEKDWPRQQRFCVFMAHFDNHFSLWLCGTVFRIYQRLFIRKEELY